MKIPLPWNRAEPLDRIILLHKKKFPPPPNLNINFQKNAPLIKIEKSSQREQKMNHIQLEKEISMGHQGSDHH
jgi:hypothetical protein